jgi:hypothetical protein
MEPWLSRETLLDLPVKGNPALQRRERAVLQGVGAELVESKAQLLRCGRRDDEIRPIEFNTRPNWFDEVGNLTARKIAQPGAAPLLLGDEIMRIALLGDSASAGRLHGCALGDPRGPFGVRSPGSQRAGS